MKSLTEHLIQLAERLSRTEDIYIKLIPKNGNTITQHFQNEDELKRAAKKYMAQKDKYNLIHGAHYDYESQQDWIYHASKEYASKGGKEDGKLKGAIKKAASSQKPESVTTMLEGKKEDE